MSVNSNVYMDSLSRCSGSYSGQFFQIPKCTQHVYVGNGNAYLRF